MVELYEQSQGDLVLSSDSLVDVLTRDGIAVIYSTREETPVAINIVREGDRGFGDWDTNKFYEIDVDGKRIFNGDFPFRHLDKTTQSSRYFIGNDVSIDDFLSVFTEAGYEVIDRTRSLKD